MNNPDKMKFETPNITAENVAKIAALFPGVVAEGKVNMDLLRTMLGEDVFTDEAYEFTWAGKREAIAEAGRPIRKTLRPAPDESKDWDSTENLYIEGDNLDVLKLLQESYLGKVKMIYIDPPYNTGNDFVYRDNFTASRDDYEEEAGVYDDVGDRLFKNTETNGRFHSDWCSMIYPRLVIARNLLRDDGVVFISIDDNEVTQLRKICDEVFGESNFVANIVWQKKYGPANDSTTISPTHDHIIVYARSVLNWTMGLLPRNENQLAAFKNPDNDPRGLWRASDLSARSYSAACDYVIVGPNGEEFRPPASRSWILNKQRYEELLADNRITFGTSGNGRPMQKKFLSEVRDGITPETWWAREFADDNKNARYEMKALFPENVFDTPKPSKLIYRLLQVCNVASNDIILDFFSGSATTAHAVMKLNAEDGGKRKFIMVQLPEVCAEGTEAAKAGYSTICEIGKERIRRAGDKIKDEAGLLSQELDIGFRVFKLADTNMNDVYYAAGDYTQDMLSLMEGNIKPDRTDMDLLFGCLIDWGLPLSLPHTHEQIDGFTVHTYNDGDLIACFAEKISETAIRKIASCKPLRAVFRDSSFASSPEKINVFEIFKLLAPNTNVRVI
ncbi:MAG: site-specific DNA-methyltransferase [Anaeromusa sp.]|uniref:site-specific DNA-methyltransferase n=1 Tax=Anaeromusa sp. TaxID=1872520 RepID=UPI002B210FF1|nr:site-specific DNA-methyltransferase [Anaeromusa sp.]MEA4833919.1 site-specific DNA-methyltransferase [Anaeromusa sp.]